MSKAVSLVSKSTLNRMFYPTLLDILRSQPVLSGLSEVRLTALAISPFWQPQAVWH